MGITTRRKYEGGRPTTLKGLRKHLKRRRRPRKTSERGKITKRCEAYLRKILKARRGPRCELCGRHEDTLPFKLSLFHILNKKRYPNLRFSKNNILLACWAPIGKFNNTYFCHNAWHHLSHVDPEYIRIADKIAELRGPDWEMELKTLDEMMPRMTTFQIKLYHEGLKMELEEL